MLMYVFLFKVFATRFQFKVVLYMLYYNKYVSNFEHFVVIHKNILGLPYDVFSIYVSSPSFSFTPVPPPVSSDFDLYNTE